LQVAAVVDVDEGMARITEDVCGMNGVVLAKVHNRVASGGPARNVRGRSALADFFRSDLAGFQIPSEFSFSWSRATRRCAVAMALKKKLKEAPVAACSNTPRR
jgi:hypothetical protein